MFKTMIVLVDENQKIESFDALVNSIKALTGENAGQIALSLKKSPGFITEARSRGVKTGSIPADTFNVLLLYKAIVEMRGKEPVNIPEKVQNSLLNLSQAALIAAENHKRSNEAYLETIRLLKPNSSSGHQLQTIALESKTENSGSNRRKRMSVGKIIQTGKNARPSKPKGIDSETGS